MAEQSVQGDRSMVFASSRGSFATRVIAVSAILGSAMCLSATLPRATSAHPIWASETADVNGSGRYASLAIDGSGAPHVAHIFQDVRYSRKSGGAWITETVPGSAMEDHGAQYTALALDPAGRAHVAFVLSADLDNDTNPLRYATNESGAWVTQGITDCPYYGRISGTAVAIDSMDQPAITYGVTLQCGQAEGVLIARRVGAPINGWFIEHVEFNSGEISSSSVAFDAGGNPHFVYTFSPSSMPLRYASKHDGAWSIESIGSLGAHNYASLRIDSQGSPVVCYLRSGDLRYARKSGDAWTIETVDSVGAVGYFASLALDPADNPHVGYYAFLASNGSVIGDLRHASKINGAWAIADIDTAGDVGLFTSLKVEPGGPIHLAYRGAGLKYARTVGDLADPETDVDPPLGTVLGLAVYPNPSRLGETRVLLPGPVHGEVRIEILDVSGRLVRSLDRSLGALRDESVPWNGLNTQGRPVSAGTYFVRVGGAVPTQVRRFTILR